MLDADTSCHTTLHQSPFRYTEASLVKKWKNLGSAIVLVHLPFTIIQRQYVVRETVKPIKDNSLNWYDRDGISRKELSEKYGEERKNFFPKTRHTGYDYLAEHFPAIVDYNLPLRWKRILTVLPRETHLERNAGRLLRAISQNAGSALRPLVGNGERRLGNDRYRKAR